MPGEAPCHFQAMPAVWRAPLLLLLLLWVYIGSPARAQNAVELSRTEDWTQSFYTEVEKNGDEQRVRSMQKRSTKTADVEVYSMKVGCIITSRFAHTIVTSKARNNGNSSQEVFFEMDLPKTAFITNFTMEIDGRSYVGQVKEKEKAKKQYDKAVSSGQTAGLVKASGRKMEKFSVSVNIAAQSNVTFILIYEELLQRKLGKYEILSRLKSEQPVQEFQIQADIYEPLGISFVEATATFLTNELLPLVEKTITDTMARIFFSPTVEQQQKCQGCEGSIINGDFIITYDVKREKNLGEIQVVNGYFVHFFSPPDLPRVPKNVVFVIDISGSMSGTKMKQTREAMVAILKDLHEEDHFAIITFDDKITQWKKFVTKATKTNVNEAKGYIKKIRHRGGTNINSAVLKAVSMLQRERKRGKVPKRSADMIILLTDGMPNSGESNPVMIQENVRSAIGGNMSLFCLGFGNDVAYSFLDVMSRQNKGLARRIFMASDAVLQLQGFYEEVSSPLLLEVDLRYSDDKVGNLTKSHYSQLFNGSEIVVAGQLSGNDIDNFLVEVVAQGPEEDFQVQGQTTVPDWLAMYPHLEYVFGDFTERLWAYLTTQQLLENSDLSSQQEKDAATAKALEMSLRYGYVTPLTSMVVTKPETDDESGSSLIADKLTEAQRQEAERQTGRIQQSPSSTRTRSRLQPRTRPAQAPPPTKVASDVDGDPHFLIELPDRDDALCFNINDKPGTIFNLVRDSKSGFLVNGQLIGKKNVVPGGNLNTYFGSFVIAHQKLGVRLEVSTQDISVFHGGERIKLLWSDSGHITKNNMDFELMNNCSLTVTLKHSVRFMVIKHTKVWKRRHDQQDYLGFYTLDSHHLSAAVHGLLGQFYHGVEFEVEGRENLDAIMYVKGHTLNVTRHWQNDFSRDVKDGKSTPCWFIDNDGAGLIDGTASDYIVSDLF
ncbi:unnamed protein product [Ophioblennius macclurei]